jgi:hypothetical protein
VTGEPSSLTVAYPGITSSHVEVVEPGGERTVTEEWPADSPTIVPTVIAYRASVSWFWPEPSVRDINVGESIEYAVNTMGNYPGDESPLGYVHFTIEGPGEVEQTSQSWKHGEGCTEVANQFGQADAVFCELTFREPGTYTIRTTYVSEDSNYADTAGPSVTVDVTG